MPIRSLVRYIKPAGAFGLFAVLALCTAVTAGIVGIRKWNRWTFERNFIHVNGPGCAEDIAYLKEIWGVVLPPSDCHLVRRGQFFMLYMYKWQLLPAYQDALGGSWAKVRREQRFEHSGFVIRGEVDDKVWYRHWEESGLEKYIFLDHGTGVMTFMAFPARASEKARDDGDRLDSPA